ncbi:bifunctional helix-turn-helix domain-containing protein/methylated-DNA--[protein]-cysteine S-methyltransferase [Chryseobacterium sp.]|uniref:bifunctional helix-turn-helix domain-containing protein/methylated-DNA--[protein]-cysteine S-methyltransferase n=1 Tax=Chryseobacterium sp. TaxID=1871047 RepID=UPI003890D83B
MSTQNQIDYYRIAKAIAYLQDNFMHQPNLEDIAQEVGMSKAHFQKLFSEWAGTSPKKFLQFLSLKHAKKILNQKNSTILDATLETGLSSTSRLHDLFVSIEGMSPAEYKNGGKNLTINYQFAETIFGNVMIASTEKGICYLAFEDFKEKTLLELKNKFPNAIFFEKIVEMQNDALSIFNKEKNTIPNIKLHLKGTNFQLKVWESLLKIPMGNLSTYGILAENIGNPRASRAVGTAIGGNPVAFLIPCHRVIQSNGMIGGYRWGSDRKQIMISWESAQLGV